MLNNLLRCEGPIPSGRVRILDELYRIAKGQGPPSSCVNAELCVHTAYNDVLHAVVSQNSFQVCAKERVGRGLSNSDVACRDLQAGGELPCGCAVLEITGVRLVLDEDDQSARISGFARDMVDSGDDALAVEGFALAFAKALLNVDDKYGGVHGWQ